ncbi:MAG: hypothetical protein FJ304_03295 [Planctomycetes bacterium]|nr:hypothetical protein [Planctomycetota bacterium]
MFWMKRAAVVTVALAAVMYFTPLGKHATVLAKKIVGRTGDMIPVQHHIDVLKEEVRGFDKDIDKKKNEVAAARVAENEAREAYEAVRAKYDDLEDALKVLARDLDKAKVPAAADATARKKQAFAAKYEAFQTAEARLGEKEKKHEAAKKYAKQAYDELTALVDAKKALEGEIASLEQMLREVEHAETKARAGDGRVAETQRKVDELRKQLAVRSERTKMDAADRASVPAAPAAADADAALKQWKARQLTKE